MTCDDGRVPRPTPSAVLEALDPEQRAAAEALRGPVCILAGAGTGKTRAITHRIAYAVLTDAVPAAQLLAVTFTARAAGEMRSRLRGLGVGGVQARTFHSAALRQLSYFWPRVVGGAKPTLVESKLPPVRAAAARCRVQADTAGLRDLATEIEWSKATLAGPDAYASAATAAGRETSWAPEVVAKVYAAYDDVNRDRGQLDFEDLLLLTAAAIEEHRDVAAEVRARYRHFVVDEYQDVNPLQQRLLDAWLGGRDDVCVVGDANQTIYSFTGASPSYLLEFPRRYPGATVVRLVRDYRSTPQVVELANGLLRGVAGRVELLAQRPPGPRPTFAEHPDEVAEAAAVAARCTALIEAGTPAREIAVLFRVNAQSEVYEAAFATADVPYLVRGGERFFDRPEVREAVLLLRAAARSPSVDDAPGLVEAVTHVLAASGWSPQPPSGSGAVREKWESVRALVGLAEELAAADPVAGLPALVAELGQRAEAQHAPPVEGVTLASLHAAKGLEWDAVFLVGLVDGTVPITHALTSPAQLEEERRLLYVGITRARVHLALSWALARAAGGRGRRTPSRFLDGLRPLARPAARVAASTGKGGRRERGLPRCRVCGTALFTPEARKRGRCAACPSTMDEGLYDRLREWRLGRSKALGVPAYVVFTDATLAAIAELRPSSRDALADIPGVGPRKLDTYGDEVLSVVAG